MRISRKRVIFPLSLILTIVIFLLLIFSIENIPGIFSEKYSQLINEEINNNKNSVDIHDQLNATTLNGSPSDGQGRGDGGCSCDCNNDINNSHAQAQAQENNSDSLLDSNTITNTNNENNNKNNNNENNNNNNNNLKNTLLENKIVNLAIKSATAKIRVNDFESLRERVELHTELWREAFGEGPYTVDTLRNSTFLIQEPDQLEGKEKLLALLHQTLYPWLYKRRFYSPKSMFRSFEGRGIVMCVGNFHFRFARSTIDTIRYVLKSELPIEIFYNGADDLSVENRRILEKFPGVVISDISMYFDNKPLQIGGWAIKPFSVLASRFKEVILIDADATYIHDPALLFNDVGYRKTGTLFFRDRTLFAGPHDGSRWLKSWMVDPLEETKALRYWKEKTSHEMESSTVVLDKSRTLLGLLAVCKFNEKEIRDEVVYKYVHGDKETFWMAFDMARQHYSQMPTPIVFVGELNVGEEGDDPNAQQLCGHVGHLGRDNKVMFWNDHIVKDKHDDRYNDRLLRFEVYLVEDKEAEWPSFHCMNLEDRKTTPFSAQELEIIGQIIQRERINHFVVSGKYEDQKDAENQTDQDDDNDVITKVAEDDKEEEKEKK